ncbi:Uncharacterised protein [Escherichia coli]|uniref:hypothetical protein n=1 Tax=Escherichia coli TaxID=562 RepID=UPI0019189032|nr:hypothetical protein [Escherichia coli]CAD6175256.1 Uncharacterised protein [Escherichia coli]
MPLPPNFLSPEDQAEYDAYMSRFSEINHYYDYRTVPVIDWFFKQATEALHHDLWIPACTSFLNGIETSLMVTLKSLMLKPTVNDQHPAPELVDLEGISVMSNALLRKAKQEGMPVELLSFPAEKNMLAKIDAGKKPEADIVRLRNSLCHGNILEFIMSVKVGSPDPIRIFTPCNCCGLALLLSALSKKWTVGLHQYWIDKNLTSC